MPETNMSQGKVRKGHLSDRTHFSEADALFEALM